MTEASGWCTAARVVMHVTGWEKADWPCPLCLGRKTLYYRIWDRGGSSLEIEHECRACAKTWWDGDTLKATEKGVEAGD